MPLIMVTVLCHVSYPGAVTLNTWSPGVAVISHICMPFPGGSVFPLDTNFPSRWNSYDTSVSACTMHVKGTLGKSGCLWVTHDARDRQRTDTRPTINDADFISLFSFRISERRRSGAL